MAEKGLLLHICCAPCGGGCVLRPDMIDPERKVTLFFSNSNIDTEAEFEKRLFYVRQLAAETGAGLIVDEYDHDAFLEAVSGLEDAPEGGARCRKCFEFNLGRAAEKARMLGCGFATTLTVSPRKSSKVLFEVGSQWDEFEKIDFKKKDGYLRAVRYAAQQGFYRQKYCGCEFSRRQAAAEE